MIVRTLLAGTVAFGTLFAAVVHAQDKPTTQPGFVPDTGQINPGHATQPPSASPSAPVADPADVRAALMMPDPGTISLGAAASSGTPQPATTGKGIADVEQPGPIGSTMQTKPAKFSRRNDLIDHTPTMAMPLRLDEAQRQQIVQAIASEKTRALEGAQAFKPADAVPFAFSAEIHPLPESIRGIPGLAYLAYMKGKDRAYLVTTRTADPVVVDVLNGNQVNRPAPAAR